MSRPEPVATVICRNYQSCGESIRRALELSGILDGLKGRRVLLKPNMMKGTPPEKAEATHPAFVGELVNILVENGCVVTAGDSTGILGFTNEVFDASGMTAAVERNGGSVVNFDAGPFVEVDLGGKYAGNRLPVSRAIFEADAVLDVPKIKTHTFLGLTLSVKNLVGVFPGAVKCGLHGLAPDRGDFAVLVSGIPAALTAAGANLAGSIVDGVLALGGRGGNVPPAPTWMGCVVAGRNLFDVDMVCAGLAGFAPSEVPVTATGIQNSLSARNVPDIPIVGDHVDGVRLARPGLDIQECAPPITSMYYKVRGNIVKPVFDPAACTDCNRCIEVCPVNCITTGGPRDRSIGDGCVRCLACREVCPTGAMGLRANPYLEPFLRKRAAGLDMSRLRPGKGK